MCDGSGPALYSRRALPGRQSAGSNPYAMPRAEGCHRRGWLTATAAFTHSWADAKLIRQLLGHGQISEFPFPFLYPWIILAVDCCKNMDVGCTAPSFQPVLPLVSMENRCKLQWFLSCFPSRGPFWPARHDWIAPQFLCQPCLCELTFYCTLYGTLKPNVKHKGFNSTPEIHCPNNADNFLHILLFSQASFLYLQPPSLSFLPGYVCLVWGIFQV